VLLAIDTSSGTSVAIVDGDRGILAEYTEPDTRRHAEVIGTLIARALDESGIAASGLSGVAVGMGPGPFTGLRVGIAAARAFAFGAGIPVVPVVSHDAIALDAFAAASSSLGASTDVTADSATDIALFVQPDLALPLLVVTDARRREVYWSAYSGADADGLPARAAGPGLVKPADLPAALSDIDAYRRLETDAVSAAAIGLLAERMLRHGRPLAGSDALYLRSPDIFPSAGPKRVSA
jgi:tRNA threonylcarbamoyl adenosine modification protein YeaZ